MARQKVGFHNDGPYDDADGSEDRTMGIHAPCGFRKKDAAYTLVHNDRPYSPLLMESCFHLLF